MHLPTPHFRPLPIYAKVIALVLIAAFVVIGLIGLILPVIPGVLFLFLAVLIATRVSRRVSNKAHSHPWFREHLRNWRASSNLSAGNRTKLALLLTARAFVDVIRGSWRLGIAALRRVRS